MGGSSILKLFFTFCKVQSGNVVFLQRKKKEKEKTKDFCLFSVFFVFFDDVSLCFLFAKICAMFLFCL